MGTPLLCSDVSAIPFNKPYLTGREMRNIAEAHRSGKLAGDGAFTRRCHSWLEQQLPGSKALLTHSCTAALEMAAILCDIAPGDEVIMPSYTFVSTANAFALRGAIPVFVDIRPDTLNIDECRIEAAITDRTVAIVVVHYAGVTCEMDAINNIAKRHGLIVIEDAAQALLSTYHGKRAGALGDMATFSFHETKNVTSGEGGALILRSPVLFERGEIIREKGTDRSRFFRGMVDKYTWVDLGSSFLPGEVIAAFLSAQLEKAVEITRRRVSVWNRYHDAFKDLEESGRIIRPAVPAHCKHNGHIYYVILRDLEDRQKFISRMSDAGVACLFHYVPLHSSPAGQRYGRLGGTLGITENLSNRIVRLPIWIGIEDDQDRIVEAAIRVLHR
jgi:dTDP-4-amino-4,6-dideoxygalactose transaminase